MCESIAKNNSEFIYYSKYKDIGSGQNSNNDSDNKDKSPKSPGNGASKN